MEILWLGLGLGAVVGIPVLCLLAGFALLAWAEKQ